METDREFTQARLNEMFEYRDGSLIWKERPISHFVDERRQKIFNTRQAGTVAGTLTRGYIIIHFKSGFFSAHRLIFLMHHGYLPPEVDHINGDTIDNRIENLRGATHEQNCKNRRIYASNTSGVKGVSFNKTTGKWVAGIRAEGKWKHLGSFSNIHDAENCRISAEQHYYGEFASGR